MLNKSVIKKFVAPLVAVSMAVGLAPARADDYPSRPVKLVIPYGTGGVSDTVGRIVAQTLAQNLGQPVVVENRGGGGGTIGAGVVAKSPADGYTLLLTSPPMVAVAPAIIPTLPYNSANDFTAIGTFTVTPNIMVVGSGVTAKNIKELVDFAKGPGKDTLTFASAGPGSTGHLSGQILQNSTGISMQHIPYKSSGQAFPDVIAGRVSMVFDSLPSTISHIRAGNVRPMLVMSEKRSPLLPEVPTAAEAGFGAATMTFWMGIEGPAGMPAPVVNRISAALRASLPAMREQLANLGAEPFFSTPAEFKAMRDADIARYGKLVVEMGLRQQ